MIVIILSAIAYFFSSGVTEHGGFLMWVAPLPVFLYALRANKFSSFFVAFTAYTLGNVTSSIYLRLHLPAILVPYYPTNLLIVSNIVDALVFAIFVLLTRFVVLRLRNWPTIFFFPALWTSYEYYTSLVSPAATIGSIAYSQIQWLGLIQIASFTGIWGITFLVTLIPSSIAIAWCYRKTKRQSIPAITIPFLLLIVTLAFGYVRLTQASHQPAFVAGLIALPESIFDLKTTDADEVNHIVDTYLDAIHELSRQGAQIILLPEKIISIKPDYFQQILNKIVKTAITHKITIIIGLNEPDQQRNIALIINPEGKVSLEYTKQKMVSFSSEANYRPGNQFGLFTHQNKMMGLAICHDIDFQGLGRGYSQKGTEVLFVPALDYIADSWLHARVAILRGVEGGYSVIRTAQWGLLTISDPYGHITHMQTSSFETPAILIGGVTLGTGNTFYAQMGDWLPWLSIILIILILMATIIKKTKFPK